MLPTNVKRHIGANTHELGPKKKRVKAGNSTNPAGKICQETLVVNGFVQLLCIGFYKFIDLFWQQCLGFGSCAFRFDTKNKTARRGESQTLQRCFYGQRFSGKTRATCRKVQLVGPVDPCSCTRCCKSRKRTLRYSYASSRRQCLENMDPMDPQEWRFQGRQTEIRHNQKFVLKRPENATKNWKMTISSLVTCSQDREVRMFLRHVSTSSGRIYATLGSDASCANRLVNCQPTFPGTRDWAKSSNSWNKLGDFFMRIWGVPPPMPHPQKTMPYWGNKASFLEGWHSRAPSNSHGFLTIPFASICSNTSLSRHTSPLPKYLPLLWRCHCRSLPQRWQLERWNDFCWWLSPNFSCWNLFLQLSIDTLWKQLSPIKSYSNILWRISNDPSVICVEISAAPSVANFVLPRMAKMTQFPSCKFRWHFEIRFLVIFLLK